MGDRIRAEILTVGAELLKGSTLNTNAQYLGDRLTRLGIRVCGQASCDDAIADIQKKLSAALDDSDLVIVTGGLGPTPDDVTRDSLADFFKVPLVFSPVQFAHISRYYKSYRRPVPAMVRKEACFPKNAVPLVNRHGIALGFYHRSNGRLIVVLPGVPRELRKMFEDSVEPLIRRIFKPGPYFTLAVRTAGLSEPAVMVKLGRRFFELPFEFGIYPNPGEVTVRIGSDRKDIIARCRARIKKSLSPWVYAFDERTLAEVVGGILRKKRQMLAVAESCTGGFLSAELTKIPGASRFFAGGIIAYGNAVKTRDLGVPAQVLARHGVVSLRTARAMAAGVRTKMGSDYGIGITGIAGPGGGGPEKPVGRVCIAVAYPGGCVCREHDFLGDRRQIQKKASAKALEYLWQLIR